MASPALAIERLEKHAADATQLLKLLANETRLLILCRLAIEREMSAGSIVAVAPAGTPEATVVTLFFAVRAPRRVSSTRVGPNRVKRSEPPVEK